MGFDAGHVPKISRIIRGRNAEVIAEVIHGEFCISGAGVLPGDLGKVLSLLSVELASLAAKADACELCPSVSSARMKPTTQVERELRER